jgi:hypothetical protein
MMYSNAPQTNAPTYMPYVGPTQVPANQQQVPQQPQPQTTSPAHPSYVPNTSSTSAANIQLYQPQTGYVATQLNNNEFQAYNMQAMANSLPQMPLNQIRPMIGAQQQLNPPQNEGIIVSQHMQSPNMNAPNNQQQTQVVEAPLISFD